MIKVVVICEDHTLDQYVLRPVIEEIMRECGRSVRIHFASDPPLHGIAQALSSATLTTVLRRYQIARLVLLIVDRDCKPARTRKIQARTEQAEKAGKRLIACLAIEEVEVWALALHRGEISDDWKAVRSHCHPKEAYFQPLVDAKQWQLGLAKGRKAAMADLRKRWDSLKALCPEVASFAGEIRDWLTNSNAA